MQYFSTSGNSPKVDFMLATISGLAPDKGLYFPEYIPELGNEFIQNLANYAKEEIAFKVIKPYTGSTLPDDILLKIVTETINFDFPLVRVNDGIYALELFHGPTLAFKDVGARFMSRCLAYFCQNQSEKITVLVATSGDTGGAVASGFYNVPGIDVVILYPTGKVSKFQEQQLTTLGNNITALEIEGTFDECQALVKQAFADENLKSKLFLTSANSINIARWLPQQFYYFFAYQQWEEKNQPPVISVPSGNFGNICAGLLAHRSGLPVSHFVAACNANDIVDKYLATGEYLPKPSVATISNAMDVGNPSNFARILTLFDKEFNSLKDVLSSYSISDTETREILNKVYHEFNYLMDTHGAVGYLALKKYLSGHPAQKGIFLETAHPVKFHDVVEPVIKEQIKIPEALQEIIRRKKNSIKLPSAYSSFSEFLLDK